MAGKKDKIKDSERFSIIVKDLDRCYFCGATENIHLHEVFYGTANRSKSKEDGMTVPLCAWHHNMSNYGVHSNKILDTKIKCQAQKIWMNYYHKDRPYDEQIEAFISRYGRSYL